MSVLTNAANTADKLIKKFGASAVWMQYNANVNAAQPWKSSDGGAPTTYNVKIVLVPFGSGSNIMDALQSLIAGTSVPMGTEQGLLSGKLTFVPAINDKVQINGEVRDIKAIDPIRPDGNVVMYTLTFA